MAKLQPLIELVNHYETPEHFKETFEFLIDDLIDRMRAEGALGRREPGNASKGRLRKTKEEETRG